MNTPAGCRLVVVFLSLLPAAFGSAPASVAGRVYAEDYSLAAPGGIRVSRQREILLRENGTYMVLWQFGTSSMSGQVTVSGSSLPPDGTWTYRRISDSAATLTLDTTSLELDFATGELRRVDLSLVRFRLFSYEPSAPMPNCSHLGYLKAGGTAVTGFTLAGRSRILVRAIGPGLALFGLADGIRQPVIVLRSPGSPSVKAVNDGWADSATLAEASRRSGAFPLPAGSRDAALISVANDGACVVEVSSADSAESGQVLIEVYILP